MADLRTDTRKAIEYHPGCFWIETVRGNEGRVIADLASFMAEHHPDVVYSPGVSDVGNVVLITAREPA